MRLTGPEDDPDASGAVAVDIRGVGKVFGGSARNDRTVALRDVTLQVHDREFLCLVGASGCGKSTLLNLVAGLDKPTSGTIDTGGRKVAFMFQESTLFPWLTLEQNIELALKLQGTERSVRKGRVEELLELVHLAGRGKRPRPARASARWRSVARRPAPDRE